MKIKNICIVNAHWSNHGDEAATKAIIKEIFKYCDNPHITMIIKDKKEITEKIVVAGNEIEHVSVQFLPQGIDFIIQIFCRGKYGKDPNMRKMIRILNENDCIIYAPGGSVISDVFWWRKQLEYMLPMIYARIYKTPIYIASPSIGPFEKNRIFRNWIRRWVFNNTGELYVRDILSKQYLSEIKAEKSVSVTVDSAFCDYANEFDKQETLYKSNDDLQHFIENYEHVVSITITELDWNVRYKDAKGIKDQISKSVTEFIEYLNARNVGVVFVPQLFANQDDTTLLEKFMAENTYILNKEYDSDFQQFLISKMYMNVGFRYHSNIFAAKNEVPFVAIVYEEKMEGFMDKAGLLDYTINVRDVSSQLLIEKYEKVQYEYEQYRNRLSELSAEWKVSAEITQKSMRDFLEE